MEILQGYTIEDYDISQFECARNHEWVEECWGYAQVDMHLLSNSFVSGLSVELAGKN